MLLSRVHARCPPPPPATSPQSLRNRDRCDTRGRSPSLRSPPIPPAPTPHLPANRKPAPSSPTTPPARVPALVSHPPQDSHPFEPSRSRAGIYFRKLSP